MKQENKPGKHGHSDIHLFIYNIKLLVKFNLYTKEVHKSKYTVQ